MDTEIIRSVWPEWQVDEKEIGKGSYGSVYRAVRRDHDVESYAAIKVISVPSDSSEIDSLHSEGLDDEASRTYLQNIVSDFVSEIRLMETLKGIQNIVSVEDYKVIERTDEIGWYILIRMELLTPFSEYTSDKTLSEEEAIRLGMDICTALEICAKSNIIHRDIKPENIFVNNFGYFKLGDFGVARNLDNLTGSLSQKGTPYYMAPEVAYSREYDARVDTYSLGIVLYRLLNRNRLPFMDTDKQLLNPNERRSALNRRLRGDRLPAPCDASPAMAEVILRACEHEPDMRFASAAEMKKALESVANGTYRSAEDELDGTTPARRAADGYGSTTPARKSRNTDQQSDRAVNTFGSAQKPKKNLLLFALIPILLLGGFFALRGRGEDVPESTPAPKTTSAPKATPVPKATPSPTPKAHVHSWAAATCTAPKTCRECGATQGSAAGHSWSKATCTEASTCTRCGATGEPALGHDWAKATYDRPKTCRRCGLTNGKPLATPEPQNKNESQAWPPYPLVNTEIVAPSSSACWLSNPEKRTITAEKGAYQFTAPDDHAERFSVIDLGKEVLMIAQEGQYGLCVYRDQIIGWVRTKHLG